MKTISKRIEEYLGKQLSDIPRKDDDLIPYLYVTNVITPAVSFPNYNNWGLVTHVQNSKNTPFVCLLSNKNNITDQLGFGIADAVISGGIDDYYRRYLAEMLLNNKIDSQKLIEMVHTTTGIRLFPEQLSNNTKNLLYYCADKFALSESYLSPLNN